jgi:alpha-1,3-glucosyltransferase
MSGYHSYILGKILEKFIPSSVELKRSLGYETPIFKIVMRFFALISDILVFHVGVNLLCLYIFIYSKLSIKKKPSYTLYYMVLLLILINPLMVIIDHGHFQYNNVMHGFFVLALFFLYTEKYILAIIFYSFCINFKQMGLYYAIPFPLYVIKKLFFSKSKKNENNNILISIIYVGLYGIVTLITNVIIYLPWLKNNKMNDVFSRIFPVRRGIYEDKVATFWCTLNIFYKLNNHFNNSVLIKLALVFTIIGCLVPILAIFRSKKITKKICTQCFFIVSFSFYLFSFHVHEKTIIVPFLAYLLNLPNMKNILPSFTLIGMFSLFPLLKRENQLMPYYLLSVLFYIISKYVLKLIDIKENEKEKNMNELNTKKNNEIIFWLMEICIFIIMIFYHFVDYNIPPPKQYPWFYPMLNAAFCFCYFFCVFLYSNYDLLQMTFEQDEINKKEKRD